MDSCICYTYMCISGGSQAVARVNLENLL